MTPFSGPESRAVGHTPKGSCKFRKGVQPSSRLVKTLFCELLKTWYFRKPLRGPPTQGVSETGRIRFRGVRFQTPNSVSFSGLTEFRGANSVSSSQPIICVEKRTHRVFRRTHRVCRKTQWVLFSETVLSRQYSARFLESRNPPSCKKKSQNPKSPDYPQK